MPKKPVISIVDDDYSVREGTMDLVRAMEFIAETFQRAEDARPSHERLRSPEVIMMPGSEPSSNVLLVDDEELMLVTDVVIPGDLNGLELADRAKTARPALVPMQRALDGQCSTISRDHFAGISALFNQPPSASDLF